MTEDQLEQETLGWLSELGYSVHSGYDIAHDGTNPQRASYREVVLAGRLRARSVSGGDARLLHSLPGYYGWNAAMFTMIPALAVMIVWLLAQPVLIERGISAMISQRTPEAPRPSDSSFSVIIRRAVARGMASPTPQQCDRIRFS